MALTNPFTSAVLVTGATGFVGRSLIAALRREGRQVLALSRDPRAAQVKLGGGVQTIASLDEIPADAGIESIVHLAGARVLGPRWTPSRRRLLLSSRTGITAQVLALIRRLDRKPTSLVAASAVGFYGAAEGASFAPLDENGPPQPGQFQSDLCAAIERDARLAEASGVRVVRMRFGIVLGHGDGAYPMQALAARLGLGAVLGSGRQPVPWIHLNDAVGLIGFAMSRAELSGAVNAVAPDTRSQADFVHALAASFGRHVLLRIPADPLRLVMGEMADLLLEGQNVVPSAALRAGYAYQQATLDGALRELARPGG